MDKKRKTLGHFLFPFPFQCFTQPRNYLALRANLYYKQLLQLPTCICFVSTAWLCRARSLINIFSVIHRIISCIHLSELTLQLKQAMLTWAALSITRFNPMPNPGAWSSESSSRRYTTFSQAKRWFFCNHRCLLVYCLRGQSQRFT
jgi:energy-coupling factor transporter transmembrane protein EcfT